MKPKLIKIIAASQDGNPVKRITEQVHDGRLCSVTDNVDRLLADCINNAVEEGDLETLLADLEYAASQIKQAWEAARQNVVGPFGKFGQPKPTAFLVP